MKIIVKFVRPGCKFAITSPADLPLVKNVFSKAKLQFSDFKLVVGKPFRKTLNQRCKIMETCSANIAIPHQKLKIEPKVLFHGACLRDWFKLAQNLGNKGQRNGT